MYMYMKISFCTKVLQLLAFIHILFLKAVSLCFQKLQRFYKQFQKPKGFLCSYSWSRSFFFQGFGSWGKKKRRSRSNTKWAMKFPVRKKTKNIQRPTDYQLLFTNHFFTNHFLSEYTVNREQIGITDFQYDNNFKIPIIYYKLRLKESFRSPKKKKKH